MKYAEKLSGITNAFKHSPLDGDELEEFYYNGTMEFRTGKKNASPIRDIFEACQTPSDRNAFLLLGHGGCGKSTELNQMAVDLLGIGYRVSIIRCAADLDLINPLYADLLILLGEALVKVAGETGCGLDDKLISKIRSFWSVEIERSFAESDESAAAAEAGFGAQTPKFIAAMLRIFANVKADLKYSEEKRTEYRERISHRSSEWLRMLNQIADAVTEKLEGKQPVIVFEDLDRLNPEDAWNVFYNYAATLTGVSIPLIYTFPIALSYDPRFAALRGYFTPITLPMIKLETVDGKTFCEGIKAIATIVEKRAKPELFENGALEKLIKQTGGSLRDLFYAINTAAQRAIRRKAQVISGEDAADALVELRSSLVRFIERKNYAFLADIYSGNRQLIEDKEMLLKMLQGNIVLEYNGKCWYNVHPLVAEFLVENGLTGQAKPKEDE